MDPGVVAAHSSPEGSLAITGGAPAVGRDAITPVAASFYEALPDTQVYLRDLVVDGIRIEYDIAYAARAGVRARERRRRCRGERRVRRPPPPGISQPD
jgi:hypothetical protein